MVTERNPIVFLDIRIGEEKVGRVILELFKNVCPITCENFRALCTGEKGIGSLGKPLHFKGGLFHKAVSQFMIQGGDITNFNGTGGESIFGPTFKDENFILKHTTPGILSMANAGPDLNSSQFFITTVPCPHLNNINVVFGKVKAGLGVVEEVSTTKTNKKDRPNKDCIIESCGELEPGTDWEIGENDGTDDIYPPFPEDWKNQDSNFDAHTQDVILSIKNSGNYFFGKHDFNNAGRKYKKALRYIEWSKMQYDYPEETYFKDVQISSLLNLAAVHLKLGLLREVLTTCDEVLKIDSNCAKAFYRRGQARVRLNDYEIALRDFEAALALVPDDKLVKYEIRSIKKTIQSYLTVEKVIYEKMMK